MYKNVLGNDREKTTEAYLIVHTKYVRTVSAALSFLIGSEKPTGQSEPWQSWKN